MKKNLFGVILASCIVLYLQGQQFKILPNHEPFAQCPDDWITYFPDHGTVNPACQYDWKVVNGEIEFGNQTGNTWTRTASVIRVRWLNTANPASIEVEARDCAPASADAIASQSISVISLQGITPPPISGTTSLPYNATGSLQYEIARMSYPNRGTSDPNPYWIESYEWEIPTGWSITSGHNTERITVSPNNCNGGTLRVRGKTLCGNYYSNWRAITINRTLGNPGSISGDSTVVCNVNTPLTFSISPVSGASSYTWTIPSGWSGSSSSNSITVTPNGLNGGTITVRANACATQSQAVQRAITLLLEDPANPAVVTGGTEILCTTGSTFTLSNAPFGATVTWSASPVNLFQSASGSGTSAPLAAYNNFTRGEGVITFTITTPCGAYTKQKTMWVGIPEFIGSVNGQGHSRYSTANLCPASHYLSIQPQGVSPGNCVSWQVPSSIPYVATCNVLDFVLYFNGPNYFTITASTSNSCRTGTYNFFFSKNTNSWQCSSFMLNIYPNPASEETTVELVPENTESLAEAWESINIEKSMF